MTNDPFNLEVKHRSAQQEYGVFKNEKHYLSILAQLLASTFETQHRYNFFIEKILPQVTRNSMIDIGVGDGKLTALMGEKFEEVTMLDTSQNALDQAEKHFRRPTGKLHKMKISIVDAELPGDSYDLAVMSHILYHVKRELWMDVTKKVMASLKKNGLLVIVLNYGLDKDLLARTFHGKTLGFDHFIENCQEELDMKSLETVCFTESFETKKLSTMLDILGLHLYDVGAVASKNKLTDFIKNKIDENTGCYNFFVYQKIILIKK